MKEETKDFQLKMRVTKSEKEQILNYCEKHNLNISEFLRLATIKQLKEEK